MKGKLVTPTLPAESSPLKNKIMNNLELKMTQELVKTKFKKAVEDKAKENDDSVPTASEVAKANTSG